jgi:aryl-alcohol dehydrogenase-like predicted oxidoreductase
VLEAFEALKSEGLVAHFGLTGLGDDAALREVIESGPWSAVQVCTSLVAPRHDDDLISLCGRLGIGVIAIRVLAGGALAGQPPSAHTQTTRFFPLEVYRCDERRAAEIAALLPPEISLREAAVRFVVGDRDVSTALVGFANPAQVDEVVRFAQAGPLDDVLRARVARTIPPPQFPT